MTVGKVLESREVIIKKNNKDVITIKDGEESSNCNSWSYTVDSGHAMRLNVVIGEYIQHIKRKLQALGVNNVPHDN